MVNERKRKLPTRATRVEGFSKKRTSTPPEGRRQSPTTASSPAVVEEALPKSIASGKPLPTVEEAQPETLSSKQYQSISESGVLAESLHRSRQKWSEGIFEKYWTKPSKRKGAQDLTHNPPKESMTKIGTCTITVEPHVLEAIVWAIKDPNPKQSYTAASQQPMYRPIIQYGPPNGMMPPPPPTPRPQPTQLPPPQPITQPSPQNIDTHMTNTGSPAPNNKNDNNNQGGVPTTHAHTLQPNRPPSIPTASPQQQPALPAMQPPQKSTDPVIQMLAERAATDPDLKALMRIVANGEASPQELKRFQSHIDELTRLEKARKAASLAAQPPSSPRPPPSTPIAQANLQLNGRPSQGPALPPPPTPVRAAPHPPAPTVLVRAEPPTQPQPQALRSKGPLPSRSDISGIVFEFVGGSGDRYLFPKFSILEYVSGPQGLQVIASFLIVRKGSSSDSPSYNPELDYYQPITIRIWSHQQKTLEALQKVVAPPDEVRRYMDDIMDNMTRAEYVLLAMRLPKEVEHAPGDKEPDSERPIQAEHNSQVLWATTNPGPAVAPATKLKPVKPPISEEEQYRAFIATVS